VEENNETRERILKRLGILRGGKSAKGISEKKKKKTEGKNRRVIEKREAKTPKISFV